MVVVRRERERTREKKKLRGIGFLFFCSFPFFFSRFLLCIVLYRVRENGRARIKKVEELSIYDESRFSRYNVVVIVVLLRVMETP